MEPLLPLITKSNFFHGIRILFKERYCYLKLNFDKNNTILILETESIYNERQLINKLNEYITELYKTKSFQPEEIDKIEKVKNNYIMLWRKWYDVDKTRST